MSEIASNSLIEQLSGRKGPDGHVTRHIGAAAMAPEIRFGIPWLEELFYRKTISLTSGEDEIGGYDDGESKSYFIDQHITEAAYDAMDPYDQSFVYRERAYADVAFVEGCLIIPEQIAISSLARAIALTVKIDVWGAGQSKSQQEHVYKARKEAIGLLFEDTSMPPNVAQSILNYGLPLTIGNRFDAIDGVSQPEPLGRQAHGKRIADKEAQRLEQIQLENLARRSELPELSEADMADILLARKWLGEELSPGNNLNSEETIEACQWCLTEKGAPLYDLPTNIKCKIDSEAGGFKAPEVVARLIVSHGYCEVLQSKSSSNRTTYYRLRYKEGALTVDDNVVAFECRESVSEVDPIDEANYNMEDTLRKLKEKYN